MSALATVHDASVQMIDTALMQIQGGADETAP
jgi:hypothetical protein